MGLSYEETKEHIPVLLQHAHLSFCLGQVVAVARGCH